MWSFILSPLYKAYEKICIKYILMGWEKTIQCFTSKTNGDVLKRESGKENDDAGLTKPTLKLLFVGLKHSGKTHTIEYITKNDCTNLFLDNTNVNHARNDDVFGRNVYAVECPSFQVSNFRNLLALNDSHNLKSALDIIACPHVFVYCIPFTLELSKEQIECIEMLKEEIGESDLKNRFILAITSGEKFDDIKDKFCSKNYLEMLKQLGRDEINDLLSWCNYRCALFSENLGNDKVRKEQLANFFTMADNMVHDNARYIKVKEGKMITKLNDAIKIRKYGLSTKMKSAVFSLKNRHAEFDSSTTIKIKQESDATNITKAANAHSMSDGEINDVSLAEIPEINSKALLGASEHLPTRPSITVVVLGRSGKENSSFSNAFLMKQAFDLNQSATFETKFSTNTGRQLTVVNSIGLSDDHVDTDLNIKAIKYVIANVFIKNTEYDAILYVIGHFYNYSKGEIKIFEKLALIIGKDVLKKHCILLIMLENEFEQTKILRDKNYDRIAGYVDRVLFFINDATENKRHEIQMVSYLINHIDNVVNKSGKYYGNFVIEKLNKDI